MIDSYGNSDDEDDDMYRSEEETKPAKRGKLLRPTAQQAWDKSLRDRVAEMEQELGKLKAELNKSNAPMLEGCATISRDNYGKPGSLLKLRGTYGEAKMREDSGRYFAYYAFAVPIDRGDLIEKIKAVLQAYKD